MAYNPDPMARMGEFGKNPLTYMSPRNSANRRMEQADWQAKEAYTPITSALNQQYNSAIDPTRRKELGSWASRGFGLSGLADQGIAGALANLKSDFDKKKSDAMQSTIDRERTMAQQEMQTQQANRAARPDKFLGIF